MENEEDLGYKEVSKRDGGRTTRKTFMKSDLYFHLQGLKIKKSFPEVRNIKDEFKKSERVFNEEQKAKKEEIDGEIEKKLRYNDYTNEQQKLRFSHLQRKDLSVYEIKLRDHIKDLYGFLLEKKEYGHYFNTQILYDLKLYLGDIEKYFNIVYYKNKGLVLIQIENISEIEKVLK